MIERDGTVYEHTEHASGSSAEECQIETPNLWRKEEQGEKEGCWIGLSDPTTLRC
jgi:hypothetical protein